MSVSPSSHPVSIISKRKAWDLNPHDPRRVARFSKPARRAVSGYLPYVPCVVDPLGIGPRFPACRAGVFPLDHEPSSGASGNRTPIAWVQARRLPVGPTPHRRVSKRSVRELNPVFVHTTDACCRNTYRPCCFSDRGWNRTIDLLVVTQTSSPLDHAIVFSSDRGGGRTHKIATPST